MYGLSRGSSLLYASLAILEQKNLPRERTPHGQPWRNAQGAACVCVGLTTCKVVFCEGTGWWYDGEPNSDDNGCSEGFCDFCSRLGDCCSRLDDRLEDFVNLVAGLLCYPRTLWRRRREVRRRRELEEVGGSAGEPTSAQAIAIELEAQEPGEAAIETAVEAGVVALLERAVEAGLTDMEAVGRMLENMRTGRFTPQHYMAIWEPRLQAATAERAPAPAAPAPAGVPPEWGLRRGLSFLAPNEYICPISLELMSDPVRVAQSAIAYERAPLEQWLSSHPRTDPKTNVTFGAPLTFAADADRPTPRA